MTVIYAPLPRLAALIVKIQLFVVHRFTTRFVASIEVVCSILLILTVQRC